MAAAPTTPDPIFGFEVVTACPGIPQGVLIPREAWPDSSVYDAAARKLAGLFRSNFTTYESSANAEVKAGGPA